MQQLIRKSLAQIISLGSSLHSEDAIHVDGVVLPPVSVYERAPQWFIAATVAISDHDRAICRKNLQRAAPPR